MGADYPRRSVRKRPPVEGLHQRLWHVGVPSHKPARHAAQRRLGQVHGVSEALPGTIMSGSETWFGGWVSH
eukprot:5751953-Prymnesium_polylepis.1